MRLTAVFEAWHIGDGNYPPLKVGQPVNLSFQVELVGRFQYGLSPPAFVRYLRAFSVSSLVRASCMAP